LRKGNSLFALLCDGMGGGKHGEVASEMCVNVLSQFFLSETETQFQTGWLEDKLKLTNNLLYDHTIQNPKYEGMATTLVTLLIAGERGFIGNVGDSRLYRYREGKLEQLTEDDSVVWELYKKNLLTKDELVKHPRGYLITKAIALLRGIGFSVTETGIGQQELFFLCSDGVTDFLTDGMITEMIEKQNSLSETGKEIIALALEEGSNDDISIILLSNYRE